MTDQTYHAKALDRFLDELIENPDVPAPIDGAMDPETIAWARRIVAAEQSTAESPAEEQAQARVWEQVVGNVQTPPGVILSEAKNFSTRLRDSHPQGGPRGLPWRAVPGSSQTPLVEMTASTVLP